VQPDIAFHLAAQPLVIDSYNNPHYNFETNLMGTVNFFEAVRNCPSVQVAVNVTTDKCYQNNEWVWGYRENDPMGGDDPYSASKGCSELITNSYLKSFFSKKETAHVASGRAGNVIGGGDWAANRIIPDMMRGYKNSSVTSVRNPNSVRPWQHVLDCLYGYLQVGEKLLLGEIDFAEAWNFSPDSQEAKNVEEVATIAKKNWDAIDIQFGIPPDNFHEAGLLILDNSKAVHKLGWKPLWNSEQAIEKTVEWYKNFYQEDKVLTKKNIEEYLKDAQR
jgi:CDP-glucose 4,6-dehydratase